MANTLKTSQINIRLLYKLQVTTLAYVLFLLTFSNESLALALPDEVTTTITDQKAMAMLANNPTLLHDLTPLFKETSFTRSVNMLKPFQQRSMIRKAQKNPSFRMALKANHQRALPAAGFVSTTSSFSNQLISAHKKGTVKIGRDGKVHGYTPPRRRSNQRRTAVPLTGKRLSTGKKVSARKKPAISTSTRTRTRSSISTRKKPSISTGPSSRKRPMVSQKTTGREKPSIATSQKRPSRSVSRTLQIPGKTTVRKTTGKTSVRKPLTKNTQKPTINSPVTGKSTVVPSGKAPTTKRTVIAPVRTQMPSTAHKTTVTNKTQLKTATPVSTSPIVRKPAMQRK